MAFLSQTKDVKDVMASILFHMRFMTFYATDKWNEIIAKIELTMHEWNWSYLVQETSNWIKLSIF